MVLEKLKAESPAMEALGKRNDGDGGRRDSAEGKGFGYDSVGRGTASVQYSGGSRMGGIYCNWRD